MDDGCVQVRRWRYTNDCKVKEEERKRQLSEEMESIVGCGYFFFFLFRSLLQLREHHTTYMHGTIMQWRQRCEKNERKEDEDEDEREKEEWAEMPNCREEGTTKVCSPGCQAGLDPWLRQWSCLSLSLQWLLSTALMSTSTCLFFSARKGRYLVSVLRAIAVRRRHLLFYCHL